MSAKLQENKHSLKSLLVKPVKRHLIECKAKGVDISVQKYDEGTPEFDIEVIKGYSNQDKAWGLVQVIKR